MLCEVRRLKPCCTTAQGLSGGYLLEPVLGLVMGVRGFRQLVLQVCMPLLQALIPVVLQLACHGCLHLPDDDGPNTPALVILGVAVWAGGAHAVWRDCHLRREQHICSRHMSLKRHQRHLIEPFVAFMQVNFAAQTEEIKINSRTLAVP